MFLLRLAYRFLFPKGRRKRFYFFSKIFTISSISLALASFMIVGSVFKAYIETMSSRYKSVYSDLIVTNTVPENSDIKKEIENVFSKDIKKIAYTGYMEVLLSKAGKIKGLALEFMDGKEFLAPLEKYRVAGKVSCVLETKGLILSKITADFFSVDVGSDIDLVFVGRNTKTHRSKYKVCAIVDFGVYNIDSRFGYISKDSIETDFPSGIYDASVKIALKKDIKLDEFAKRLRDKFAPVYIVKTWKDINYGTLRSAQFDKMVISIILAILIAIASFNVAVTLILSMRYSKDDMAILWIQGLTTKQVRQLIMYEGIILSFISILFSLLIWTLFFLVLKYFISVKLPYSIYSLHSIPLEFSFFDFSLGVFCVLFFVLLVSYLVSFLWNKKGVLGAFSE